MGSRALLVIDLQNDYFSDGRWPLAGIEEAAANAARLIAAARSVGDLVVHVRHEFPTPDAPFFAPGSDGARTHPSVQPIGGEVQVLKNHVNAFQDTELKEVLADGRVDSLVVCGAMSHMCIDAATRAAADLGYRVTVAEDACATRDLEFGSTTVPAQQVHAAFMSALGFAYADVVTTDRVLRTFDGAEPST